MKSQLPTVAGTAWDNLDETLESEERNLLCQDVNSQLRFGQPLSRIDCSKT